MPAEPALLATVAPPLNTTDFAAQVNGFHLPEQAATDGVRYTWTNGEGLLRLPWPDKTPPDTLVLELAGGVRPAHIGPAEVCLSIQPEDRPWPGTTADVTELGCLLLDGEMQRYRLSLPALAPPPGKSILLRLQSRAWVPIEEDPRLRDGRAVGIQFGGLVLERTGAAAEPEAAP